MLMKHSYPFPPSAESLWSPGQTSTAKSQVQALSLDHSTGRAAPESPPTRVQDNQNRSSLLQVPHTPLISPLSFLSSTISPTFLIYPSVVKCLCCRCCFPCRRQRNSSACPDSEIPALRRNRQIGERQDQQKVDHPLLPLSKFLVAECQFAPQRSRHAIAQIRSSPLVCPCKALPTRTSRPSRFDPSTLKNCSGTYPFAIRHRDRGRVTSVNRGASEHIISGDAGCPSSSHPLRGQGQSVSHHRQNLGSRRITQTAPSPLIGFHYGYGLEPAPRFCRFSARQRRRRRRRRPSRNTRRLDPSASFSSALHSPKRPSSCPPSHPLALGATRRTPCRRALEA